MNLHRHHPRFGMDRCFGKPDVSGTPLEQQIGNLDAQLLDGHDQAFQSGELLLVMSGGDGVGRDGFEWSHPEGRALTEN